MNSVYDLQHLYGLPKSFAKIKMKPCDFKVYENLKYSFAGVGEHYVYKVRKTGENTQFVANELARFANTNPKNIGFAGLKDRHAVTEQWFSIYVPKNREFSLDKFQKSYTNIQIIEKNKHNKKIKKGDVSYNTFNIKIRNISNLDDVVKKINFVKTSGFPNYFGPQRFGKDNANIQSALELNQRRVSKNLKSIYLSAIRSYFFNEILSERIHRNIHRTELDGDFYLKAKDFEDNQFMLDYLQDTQDKSFFLTGSLLGDNRPEKINDIGLLENGIISKNRDLFNIIKCNRMQLSQRLLIIKPMNLSYYIDLDSICIKFDLPSGVYATSLMRELFKEI